jgi:DNA-binding NtrC family response regulator/pSer/pThr/pTyr-binding forkhead associated (FHA) protein
MSPSDDVSRTLTWDESTVSADSPSWGGRLTPARAGEERTYLLVFERDSSTLFQLPASGEVVIGRAETAHLQLRDSSVSRAHAKIVVSGGAAQIADLGSQNGTRVNGERLAGARALANGDVITVCSITLVYNTSARPTPRRQLLELAQFRQRAEEELERSLRYDRPLTVAALALGAATDRVHLSTSLGSCLRLMDVAGLGGADQVLVLMPEVGGEEAAAAAKLVLGALVGIAPAARAGYATCPADGCDVDTLLASARAALLDAQPGRVATSTRSYRTIQVANQPIVVADPAMTRLFTLIERLAASDLPVLVCGETGTGKEICATALHHWSARREKPLVTLNCAALQETLVESELFGYERGAFTGAAGAKPGLLERGSGGTVFLDEVGELSATAQAKLLRVLETKRMQRLGDVREREIDIRVVAATNRNLETEVRDGRFRQDLFFRLSGGMLWIPPLRDRRRELSILAQTFLHDACARAGREPLAMSDATMRVLAAYRWPGNVRELRNLMEFAAATVAEPMLEPSHITPRLSTARAPTPTVETDGWPLEPLDAGDTGVFAIPDGAPQPRRRPIDEEIRELERTRMAAALAETNGNQTKAAELIGMALRTFQTKVKQYGLAPAGEGRRKG